MQYRTFHKTGEEISLLGFGTMRLPVNADGKVDEKTAISMIRKSIDRGVNYVDTAWMYHDGESERVLGKALKDGYREKVLLADKMPIWFAKDEAAMKELFEEQFRRLDVEVIDMYLLHNVNASIWRRAKKLNVMPFLEEMKAAGRIKHIGFSFHDELPVFKEVLDAYPWDFCQIQLNYMDKEVQAGVSGLEYAGSKNIPVVVMEPLKGGLIIDSIPGSIRKFWKEAETQRTPAAWALRWVANFPEVMTILSGMSAMEQLDENLEILSDAHPGSLTKKELELIDRVSDEYNKLIKYSCTACKYCMPCPQKIDIPKAVEYYNNWFLYDGNPKLLKHYFVWMAEGRRASDCTACKACEGHCPQSLPISEIMKKVAAIYEPSSPADAPA